MSSALFVARRAVLPSGVAPACLHVVDGRIAAVEPIPEQLPDDAVVVPDAALLLPGLVDTHVHVNEPGRTEWEGFASATRAAAAGGVTTLLDMPLNSIPATTTAAALAAKRAAAATRCYVDVGFIGGIVPDNADALEALQAAGILAWKCFLTDSGVPEFPAVDAAQLRRVLPFLMRGDLPLMVHAELPDQLRPAVAPLTRYGEYLATRPVAAEVRAVEQVIELAREFAAQLHVVHVSCREAAELIAEARRHGVHVSGETCPHYLTFAAEEIPDGAPAFKCAPPIRDRDQRAALWSALERGALQMVVSDHSPAPPAIKALDSGDLASAWGGIASLELGLAAVWTGLQGRTVDPASAVAAWMAAEPAAFVRLARKGHLAPGCDADMVVFEPDVHWTVHAGALHQRHPVTPYDGLTLAGRVRSTYLRGALIYDAGRVVGAPAGRLLDRSDA